MGGQERMKFKIETVLGWSGIVKLLDQITYAETTGFEYCLRLGKKIHRSASWKKSLVLPNPFSNHTYSAFKYFFPITLHSKFLCLWKLMKWMQKWLYIKKKHNKKLVCFHILSPSNNSFHLLWYKRTPTIFFMFKHVPSVACNQSHISNAVLLQGLSSLNFINWHSHINQWCC